MTQAIPRFRIGLILALLLVAATLAMTIIPSGQSHAQSECAPPSLATPDWVNTDFCNSSVDFSEIFSGGPRKDGIPAVDNPNMETVDEARQWLVDRSPVIAVEIDGEARAYPQAILIWHEITNDTLAGVPITVTFCPLCNSSIVFDGRVGDDVLTFGVSGNLRNSDMVMYDRQTDSWWQQFTGEGIVGDYNGTLLDFIPSQVIGFGQFAERYPDGLVMSRDTGASRSYGSNPYAGYEDSSRPFLFRGDIDDRLFSMERVLAGVVNDEAIAYPFSVLSEQSVINDTVGGTDVVAIWQSGVASSMGDANIDTGRDIGTVALYDRTLDGQVLTFSLNSDGIVVDDQTGSEWNLFGEAVSGELAGSELEQLVAAPHFWFAWAAFQPETSVYGI